MLEVQGFKDAKITLSSIPRQGWEDWYHPVALKKSWSFVMNILQVIHQSTSSTGTQKTFLLSSKCTDLENFTFLTALVVSILSCKNKSSMTVLCVSLCDGHEEGLHILGSGWTEPGAVLRSQVLPWDAELRHPDRHGHRGEDQGGWNVGDRGLWRRKTGQDPVWNTKKNHSIKKFLIIL